MKINFLSQHIGGSGGLALINRKYSTRYTTCKLFNFKVLRDEFNFTSNFNYFVGHSLGEHSALVSSGALNFTTLIFII